MNFSGVKKLLPTFTVEDNNDKKNFDSTKTENFCQKRIYYHRHSNRQKHRQTRQLCDIDQVLGWTNHNTFEKVY